MKTIVAIDIGNTRTKIGIFKGKTLTGELSIMNNPLPSSTKMWNSLKQVIHKKNITDDDINGIVISSVVPSTTKLLTTLIKRHLSIKPLIVSGVMDVGLKICYRDPRTLGADRICSAVAAYKKYGGPLIVIDLGTATTYNVISKKGEFLGGAISPGFRIISQVLHHSTARLPGVDLHFPKRVIGTTTAENIQSGIFYGGIDAMKGMIRRIKKFTGKQTKIVLTGGGSHLIKSEIDIQASIVPSLVLHGARLIYERAKNSAK